MFSGPNLGRTLRSCANTVSVEKGFFKGWLNRKLLSQVGKFGDWLGRVVVT